MRIPSVPNISMLKNICSPARCGLVLAVLIASAVARADKVDDYIRTQMQRKHIPGLSLVVIKDGRIVKAKGYGLANVETNTPASPETVYKIASISKQFLAAGTMLLVEEGKLGLDDKLTRYLAGAPDAWNAITIRHLLTHTSGLDDVPDGLEYRSEPDAEVIKSAYPIKLLFAPGDGWNYSNLGYEVLAEIIHKVSGETWSQYLAQRLFVPTGMNATRTTTTTDLVPNRANGYNWSKGRLENAENWTAVRASGAFLSNVLDLAKWDAALNSTRILDPSVLQQMWTPATLNNGTVKPYGFGWFLDPWRGHRRVYHGGSLPGFLSDFERFIDDKLTVIVLMNSGTADPKKISLSVAGFYVPALTPPVFKPIPDAEPEVTAKVEAMISGFVSGHLDTSLFPPGLASDLAVPGHTSGMSNALREPGEIRSIVLVDRSVAGNRRQYRYRVSYANDSLLLKCTFGPDNKITGFGIEQE